MNERRATDRAGRPGLRARARGAAACAAFASCRCPGRCPNGSTKSPTPRPQRELHDRTSSPTSGTPATTGPAAAGSQPASSSAGRPSAQPCTSSVPATSPSTTSITALRSSSSCCRGGPTLRTPEGERQLAVGEVVHFPAGPDGTHGLRNDTDDAGALRRRGHSRLAGSGRVSRARKAHGAGTDRLADRRAHSSSSMTSSLIVVRLTRLLRSYAMHLFG